MKKLIVALFITVTILFYLVAIGQTEKKVDIEYFYYHSCPKCMKAGPIVDNVTASYEEQVNIAKCNVVTDEGLARGKKYKVSGLPYIVINEKMFITYKDYNGDLSKLETLLREAIDKAKEETDTNKNTSVPITDTGTGKIILSIPSVFVVGLLVTFFL